jgi:hypothetical protein
MNVQEGCDAYLRFSASIFRPKRKKVALLAGVSDALKTSGRFDTENFEKCIKNIVKERLGDENATLLQDGNSKCKVYCFPFSKRLSVNILILLVLSLPLDARMRSLYSLEAIILPTVKKSHVLFGNSVALLPLQHLSSNLSR